MKKELKDNKYLILTIVLLLTLAIFTPMLYKNLNNSQTAKDINLENLNQSNTKNINKDNEQNNTKVKYKENDNQDNKLTSSDNTNTNQNINNTPSNNNNDNYQEQNSEEDVVTYFEEMNHLLTTSSTNEMTDSLKTKLKNGFTTIVDFLFYDKPIKGYTFKELTLSAKLKICKIALSIDHKIDEYFPSYKETIKDGFTSLKGKVVTMYLELTSKACEKVGSTICNQAKSDFKSMKEVLKIDWQLIRDFAGNSKESLSQWYQSLK